jgi:hypothetical protein
MRRLKATTRELLLNEQSVYVLTLELDMPENVTLVIIHVFVVTFCSERHILCI